VRIAVASDHAGFEFKRVLLVRLRELGHEVTDFGTGSTESVDYPLFGVKAARAVASGEAERGVIICATGIGMGIVSNKVKGVRAAVCATEFMAEMSRRHNDANVLCMGQRVVDEKLARRMLEIWLETPFDGGRHERRTLEITEIEAAE